MMSVACAAGTEKTNAEPFRVTGDAFVLCDGTDSRSLKPKRKDDRLNAEVDRTLLFSAER
jgi:hypothetical protein